MVHDLDYEGNELLLTKRDSSRNEQKNNIWINVLCYENDLTYPVYVSNETFENCKDLLMIIEENRSHYVYIKYFNRFMCNKTKNTNKKRFCRCLQCFSRKKVLEEHQKVCLKINGKQRVKLRSGSI